MNKANRTTGFSLVELIVVMVIIGLLAAIIGSNMVGHREVVGEATIQSVLLQVGQAQERYASRNNTYYSGPANVSNFPAWTGVDLNEVRNEKGVTVNFRSANASTYCVEAHANGQPSEVFSLVAGEEVRFLRCTAR